MDPLVPLDLALFGWLMAAPVALVLADWMRMQRERRRAATGPKR